jgi:hypothetical protein
MKPKTYKSLHRRIEMERIFALGFALALFGLMAMVITAMSGFYPSTIYYFFGGTMLTGFAICFLTVLCCLLRYVVTGKDPF